MSEYNVKNYTEQGGDVTHIGGVLEFGEGASLSGFPGAANQAVSSASTVANLKDDFNSALVKLKEAGLMAKDVWPTITVAKLQPEESEDHKAEFEANMALVDSVSFADGVLTIAADIENMTVYESVAGYGEHKWIGVMLTTGFDSILGISLNGTEFTQADVDEASRHSGSAGDFDLYVAADTIDGKSIVLSHAGTETVKITFTVTPAN